MARLSVRRKELFLSSGLWPNGAHRWKSPAEAKIEDSMMQTVAEYGDMTKPSAFIGSSSEGLEFARAMQGAVDR